MNLFCVVRLFSGIVIGERKFTNKTPRRMGISRMAEAEIPVDKGMMVTGHRDVKSYNQYNANPAKIQMDTCQRIISGETLKYSEVLSEEKKKAHNEKVRFFVHLVSLLVYA